LLECDVATVPAALLERDVATVPAALLEREHDGGGLPGVT
jgi:hypothetical protein